MEFSNYPIGVDNDCGGSHGDLSSLNFLFQDKKILSTLANAHKITFYRA